MPFVSKSQNAYFHTPAGVKALGGQAKVREWEAATDYSKLPQRVPAKGSIKRLAGVRR